ncbi:MAG TPA: signal peptidase II [Verrucomicrobiae bacterium]|nr:signal peptidase II [Verrucomicrobiae bacterium]
MKPKYLILSIVTALVLLLDQGTKLIVDRTMALHDSITIFQNFFHLTYIRNKGAAFGMLASSPYRLPFFLIISVVAIAVIIAVYRRLHDDQWTAAFALSLIFSGAIGNLIDRFRLGEVIDFIDVHWYEHHWPAFNIADSAICVGVFLLAIDMIVEERRLKAKNKG